MEMLHKTFRDYNTSNISQNEYTRYCWITIADFYSHYFAIEYVRVVACVYVKEVWLAEINFIGSISSDYYIHFCNIDQNMENNSMRCTKSSVEPFGCYTSVSFGFTTEYFGLFSTEKQAQNELAMCILEHSA